MTSLDVEIPAQYEPERVYAARVVLGSLLGYEPRVRVTATDRVRIGVPGERGRLSIDEGLFATRSDRWLAPDSVPSQIAGHRHVDGALAEAFVTDRRLPVLFGDGNVRQPLFEHDPATGDARLHLDVFGVAFFGLTRYEERADRRPGDEHGRFPAKDSLAGRGRFLRRPIVDEFAGVLRSALHVTWPRLPEPTRGATVWLTHDVDWPLVTLRRSPREIARSTAADLVARRSPALAYRRVRAWRAGRRGDFRADPGDTFDFLMSVAEESGVAATFTFLAGGSAALDGRYDLSDPWIRRLLLRIAKRGHEIGFHASYDSYDDTGRIAAEFATLRCEAGALGIDQPAWRGRQHFLRWRNPETWRGWSEAGLALDSSVAFAEAPGFRAGTCHAYPVFDLDRRRELPLVELPLTLMDVSASCYERLDHAGTVELARDLAAACRRVGGTFVLLWHNDAVMTEPSRVLYRDVVAAAMDGSA
jgi:hypothetical protein